MLTACATNPSVLMPVNTALLEDCDYPVAKGATYRDIVEAFFERGKALEACTADKKLLREEVKKKNGD